MDILQYQPGGKGHAQMIASVERISRQEPNLIYRPLRELQAARIFCARENSASAQGALLGFVCLLPFNRKYDELGTLYVAPQARGKGVAKALLREAVQSRRSRRIITRTNLPPLKRHLRSSDFVPLKIKRYPRLALRFFLSRGTSPLKLWKFLRSINGNSCVLIYKY